MSEEAIGASVSAGGMAGVGSAMRGIENVSLSPETELSAGDVGQEGRVLGPGQFVLEQIASGNAFGKGHLELATNDDKEEVVFQGIPETVPDVSLVQQTQELKNLLDKLLLRVQQEGRPLRRGSI